MAREQSNGSGGEFVRSDLQCECVKWQQWQWIALLHHFGKKDQCHSRFQRKPMKICIAEQRSLFSSTWLRSANGVRKAISWEALKVYVVRESLKSNSRTVRVHVINV
jgi:hypothetical protein